MSFKFIEGKDNKKIEVLIRRHDKSTESGIRKAFYFLGKDLKATTNKNILKRPRFGNEEVFRGRRRRASRPGESFANRSGDARKTLGYDVRGGDQLEFGFRANSKTIYTKSLEEDANRPTLKIATKDNARNAREHFEREIERAHKKDL